MKGTIVRRCSMVPALTYNDKKKELIALFIFLNESHNHFETEQASYQLCFSRIDQSGYGNRYVLF